MTRSRGRKHALADVLISRCRHGMWANMAPTLDRAMTYAGSRCTRSRRLVSLTVGVAGGTGRSSK